jgi:chromate transport protein ChrA
MVAYIRRVAVERRGWLAPDDFEQGVALCQVIPGATAMQTAAYVGLRARGVAGAAASFIGFALPAFIVMVALSALYDRTHALSAALALFQGLRAVVVALVAEAVLGFGWRARRRFDRGGMSEARAMRVMGLQTAEMSRRYNFTTDEDAREGLARLYEVEAERTRKEAAR